MRHSAAIQPNHALRALAGGLCLALASLPAFAHTADIGAEGSSMVAGFLHPILGPDHLLAMLAVGIWGTQIGGAAVWALPVAFPLIMACGAVLGIAGVPVPAVEYGIAGSVVVLGGLIALVFRPTVAIALAVVSVFALFHGHAHGAELPDNANAAGFTLGFVLGTGLIHAAGIGIALLLERLPKGPAVIRVLGGLIALCGVYFLIG